MYNRYIPQPDGTYRRSQRQDTGPQPPMQPPLQQPCPPPKPVPEQHRPEPSHHEQHRCRRWAPPAPPPRTEPCRDSQSGSVCGFLKNLLPKDFDTGDLLIVLLLLLMAGDCPVEQNTALLTLVLYLFL